MSIYKSQLEKEFNAMVDPCERLAFLCEIRAQMKDLDDFLKASKDWTLEQTDADLKASGVSYKVVPAIRRLSSAKIREADPNLYSKLMELYSSESKEYIQVSYKGVKK